MSGLRSTLEEYLTLRAQFGWKDCHLRRYLNSFVQFAEREGAITVTTDLALRWATEPKHVQPGLWARRLGKVRGFACYLSAFDERVEIPPKGLLPHRYPRREPYLFSDEEVDRLLEAARGLPAPTGLWADTYTTALGLLSVTGMRTGEFIALDRPDVDLDDGILCVRRSKREKSRLLPLHSSTIEALRHYARRRDATCVRQKTPSFFVCERGDRLSISTVERTFRELCQQTGLDTVGRRRRPRLLDFRHRFAVKTLVDWYKAGVDVQSCLLHLSTYLGHTNVADTYWYLSATPELLELARCRQESLRGGRK